MKKMVVIILLAAFALAATPAQQTADVVISPGDDVQARINEAQEGETIWVHGGTYSATGGGYVFPADNITLSNYPGEQVVFQGIPNKDNYWSIFRCLYTPPGVSEPYEKRNGIKIIGQDVSMQMLPSGTQSEKGIVIHGSPHEADAGEWSGFEVSGCDYWEVSGLDFVYVSNAVFQKKRVYSNPEPSYYTRGWWVHDNRVWGWTREPGMQFNGHDNLIENNEIYRVLSFINSPYGCAGITVLGHNNVVRNNRIVFSDSAYKNCWGILLEWDLADNNLLEKNVIFGQDWSSVKVAGGDNNIIRDNLISTIITSSYANAPSSSTAWPCNDAESILPANIPGSPDYANYYNPRECASTDNEIYDNEMISELPPEVGLQCVQVVWDKGSFSAGLNLRESASMFNPGAIGFLYKGATFEPMDVVTTWEGTFAKYANEAWIAMDLLWNANIYAEFVDCPQ